MKQTMPKSIKKPRKKYTVEELESCLHELNIDMFYLAGPVRAKGLWQHKENIERAARIARKFWIMGIGVFCPHLNNAFFDGPELSDNTILELDFKFLERIGVLVVMPKWEKSIGTRGEILYAQERGIPIFYLKND
jgi:hypothetical protein